MILAAAVTTSLLTPDEFRNLLTVIALFLTFATIFLLVRAQITGRKVKKTADDTAVVRYQVENSHTINLRDDADVKHDTTTTMQERILTAITELRTNTDRNFALVRVDIQRLNDHDDRDDKRLKDLERTQPAKPVRKPRSTAK